MARNMHIGGRGTMEGGRYDEVHISGSGSITGPLECELLHISGSCTAEQSLTVGTGTVSGSTHCRGDLQVGKLRVSGAFTGDGDLTAGELTVSGSARIGGYLQAETGEFSGSVRADGRVRGGKLRASGRFDARGGVECEELRVSGRLTAEGLVNVGTLEILLHGDSSADEIGGETITVRQPEETGLSGFLSQLLDARRGGRLRANVIEGTEVSLENTECRAVRGQRVTIGPGCSVGKVEYSESLTVSPDSTVGERVRTEGR